MQLVDVIKAVESSNNAKRLRFESTDFFSCPGWIERTVPKIQSAHGGPDCSLSTARMIGCTSWGFFQILGANIFALGYDKTVFDFVASEADQTEIFGEFIAPKEFSPDDDITEYSEARGIEFATFYNGPGFPKAYWAAMKKVAGLA